MAYELVTVLLGGFAGAALMLYLAFKTPGQSRSTSAALTTSDYAPMAERAIETVTEAPAVAPPAPSPAPALYEAPQPAPAPVTYTAPSTTTFGAPTLAKKPTRKEDPGRQEAETLSENRN